MPPHIPHKKLSTTGKRKPGGRAGSGTVQTAPKNPGTSLPKVPTGKTTVITRSPRTGRSKRA